MKKYFIILFILLSFLIEISFSHDFQRTMQQPTDNHNYIIVSTTHQRHSYPYIAACVCFSILITILTLVICYATALG